MAMDVEAEIRDLKRRVGELEGSFGFLTQQVKALHTDLLAFQARTEQRFDNVVERLDKMDGRLGTIDGRLGGLEKQVRSLREDMPGIVGDAVREVLREPRSRARIHTGSRVGGSGGLRSRINNRQPIG